MRPPRRSCRSTPIGILEGSGKMADLTIEELDFVPDREPDPDEMLDPDATTEFLVTLTLSGRTLARLLGKQLRVLRRALEKLDSQKALRLLLNEAPPPELRRAARRLLSEYFAYDLVMDPPTLEVLEWSEVQDLVSVRVSPVAESIKFEDLELSALFSLK